MTKLIYHPFFFPSLLNQEGSLMAFAGKSEKKEYITAAIAANIWMSYENNSKAAMEDDSLKIIVLNCEVSCVVRPWSHVNCSSLIYRRAWC